MEGPGQLVHPRHRFYGSWSRNLPRGKGCFTFELNCMQHGYYAWIRDPQFDAAMYEQVKLEKQQPPIESNPDEKLVQRFNSYLQHKKFINNIKFNHQHEINE